MGRAGGGAEGDRKRGGCEMRVAELEVGPRRKGKGGGGAVRRGWQS